MESKAFRSRSLVFATGLALGATVVGCGDPPPPPVPDAPPAEEETTLRTSIELTYHRGEEPVRVTRSVSVSVPAEGVEPTQEAFLEAVLQLLVAGPSAEEREQGMGSFFSETTADILRSVEIRGDLAVVDFHDFRPLLPNVSASAGSMVFLTELNGTVFANAPVREVEYRLGGSCEAFWSFLQRDCTVVSRPVGV